MLGLAIVLICSAIVGCTDKQETAPASRESMKGFEIYSWQENDAWRFSLLIGTNRLKTTEEVKADETRLSNVGELKRELGRLERGQYVSWPNERVAGLEPPPSDLVQEIKDHCEMLGLVTMFP
jgi:hypothetical protein